MRLFMKVVSEQAGNLGYRQSHVFDQNGGTVGRSKSCDWVLPDDTTTLSARHALVRFNGRGFLIEDTSTNGVYLNSVDAPLGRGNAAILSDGDVLYLGHFVIEIAVEARSDDAEREPRAGPPQAMSPPGLDSPLAMPQAAAAATPRPVAPLPLAPLDALARLHQARPVAAAVPLPPRAPSPGSDRSGLSGGLAPVPAPQPVPSSVVPAPVLPPSASLFGLPGSQASSLPPALPAAGGHSFATPPAFTGSSATSGIPDDFFDALVVAPAQRPNAPPPQAVQRPGMAPVIPLDFDFAPARAVPPSTAIPSAPLPPLPVGMSAPAAAEQLAPISASPMPVSQPSGERARPPLSDDLAADLVSLRLPEREPPVASAVADPMDLLRQRAARRPTPPERRPPDALMEREGAPLSSRSAETPPMPMPVIAPPVTAVKPAKVAAAPAMPMPGAARGAQPEAADPFAAVWTAFGLDPSGLSREEMAVLAGELAKALASMAEGLVVTLGARRMVKDTFRMDQTQLRAQGNNPFKFASSGAAALRHFVGNDKGGFLSLSAAIEEGFADIKSHELAAMMAAQTMIGTLLDDLSPRRIEDATPAQGLLSRKPDKARLWDTFAEKHAQRAQSVAGTTQTMFGAAFAQAYQHQVAQRQERKT